MIITKINIGQIFVAHIDTLRDDSTNKYSFADFFTLYIVPAALGTILAFLVLLPLSLNTSLITFLSIFAALLFNLLVLVLDAVRKEKEKTASNERLLVLLKQTYANIAYGVVIALLGVIGMLVPYGFDKLEERPDAHFALSIAIYFLTIHFLFVLAMVLKRMDAILKRAMED